MLSRSLARSVAPLVSARAAHTDKHMPDLQYFRKQAKLKNLCILNCTEYTTRVGNSQYFIKFF